MDDARTRVLVPVSLVITSRRGGRVLLECVQSFLDAGDEGLEVIVAECADPAWRDAIRRDLPRATVLHFDEPRTTPELRAAGLLAAHGDIVALTTDHCRPGDRWLQALRRAHEDGHPSAVGGAVEYAASSRLLNWAVYFCEYGRFMLPFDRGETRDLPAQNVSYTRAAIEAFSDLLAPATWEPLWHRRLVAKGHAVVRDPSVVVWLCKRYRLRAFLAERFHYSRSFSADRLSRRSSVTRVGYGVAALCLPPVLLARIVGTVLRRRRRRDKLARSLPYLALFAIVWAAGEFAGAVAGAGASARRID